MPTSVVTPLPRPPFFDVQMDFLVVAATFGGAPLNGRHRNGGPSFASYIVQNTAPTGRSLESWRGRGAFWSQGGRHYVNVGIPIRGLQTVGNYRVAENYEAARIICDWSIPGAPPNPADDFGLFFGFMANTGTAGISNLSAGGRGFGLAAMANQFEFQSKTVGGIPAGYAERTVLAWPPTVAGTPEEFCRVEFRLFAATATTGFVMQLFFNDVLQLERGGGTAAGQVPIITAAGGLNENAMIFELRGGGASPGGHQSYTGEIRIVMGPNVPELFQA